MATVKLDEFVRTETLNLYRFKRYWEAEQKKYPARDPAELSHRDWWDLFMNFCDLGLE